MTDLFGVGSVVVDLNPLVLCLAHKIIGIRLAAEAMHMLARAILAYE